MRRSALLVGVVLLVSALAVGAAAAPPPAPACPVCEDRLTAALAEDPGSVTDTAYTSEATVRVAPDGTATWIVRSERSEPTDGAIVTSRSNASALESELERAVRESRGFDGQVRSADVTLGNDGTVETRLVVEGTVERHAGALVYTGFYAPPGRAISDYRLNAERLVVEGPEGHWAAVMPDAAATEDRATFDRSTGSSTGPDTRTTVAFADGPAAGLQARAGVLGFWLPRYATMGGVALVPVGLFALAFGVAAVGVGRGLRLFDAPERPGARGLAAGAAVAALFAAVAPPGAAEVGIAAAAVLAVFAAARWATDADCSRRVTAALVGVAPVLVGCAIAAGRLVAALVGEVPVAPVRVVGFTAVFGVVAVAGVVAARGRWATVAGVAGVAAAVFLLVVVALGPAAGTLGWLPLVLAVGLVVFVPALVPAYAVGLALGRRHTGSSRPT